MLRSVVACRVNEGGAPPGGAHEDVVFTFNTTLTVSQSEQNDAIACRMVLRGPIPLTRWRRCMYAGDVADEVVAVPADAQA